MKIASWNVNSVKARMGSVMKWLEAAQPDIVALQEIKTVDENFPRMEIEALGYNIETHGQKSYNGVALLSKLPFEEVRRGLPGEDFPDSDDPDQSRYIEGVFSTAKGVVRVASIYLPNGNPVGGGDSVKYQYKLRWMERLRHHAADLLKLEEPLVLAGDYNVIPGDADVHDPKGWWGDALFRPETHLAYQALLGLGLYSAFDQLDGRAEQYTFWDYQRGAWQNNLGIRIDHLLCSAQAIDRAEAVEIHKQTRDYERPSDHVPIIGTFDL